MEGLPRVPSWNNGCHLQSVADAREDPLAVQMTGRDRLHNGAVVLSSGEVALCRRLSGQSHAFTPEVIAAARRHRLHLLLAASLSGDEKRLVEAQALRRELQQAAVLDAHQEQELVGLLAACAARGVESILLKGAALAYTIYAAPHLRPRVDTDLMIRRDALPIVEDILAANGWTHPVEPQRDLSAAQSHYMKPGPAGTTSQVDVHWRIANPRVFADAISFDELHDRAVAVPSLGWARACSTVDALLLACIHRVAHHDDEIDLLWLWDIHLLAERLSVEERVRFVALARRTTMTAVSQRGVALAVEFFGGTASTALSAILSAGSGSVERSAQFIGGAARATTLRADLTALPTWRLRGRLVAEHLFPSMDYMRARYPGWPPRLLPLAYLDRIVRGAPKWLRSPRARQVRQVK
jgi:Uncharacterised nucleotidyltransferase